MSKTTTLHMEHTFFVHFSASVYDHDVMPNFTLLRRTSTSDYEIFFCFGTWIYGSSPTFNKVTWVGLIAVKNERAADVVVERRHWLTLGVRLVVLLDIKEKECRMTASLFNSFCSNVAKQVACFLLPVFPYLKLVQRWPVSWIRSFQVAPHYLNGFKRTFRPNVVDALLVGNGKHVVHCNQFPPIFDPPYMDT